MGFRWTSGGQSAFDWEWWSLRHRVVLFWAWSGPSLPARLPVHWLPHSPPPSKHTERQFLTKENDPSKFKCHMLSAELIWQLLSFANIYQCKLALVCKIAYTHTYTQSKGPLLTSYCNLSQKHRRSLHYERSLLLWNGLYSQLHSSWWTIHSCPLLDTWGILSQSKHCGQP